jgi:hypothetical protein
MLRAVVISSVCVPDAQVPAASTSSGLDTRTVGAAGIDHVLSQPTALADGSTTFILPPASISLVTLNARVAVLVVPGVRVPAVHA